MALELLLPSYVFRKFMVRRDFTVSRIYKICMRKLPDTASMFKTTKRSSSKKKQVMKIFKVLFRNCSIRKETSNYFKAYKSLDLLTTVIIASFYHSCDRFTFQAQIFARIGK